MGEMSLPTHPASSELTLLKLAREIAMDIRPLEDVLNTLELSPADWEEVQRSETFQRYLRNAVEEWTSAVNTAERVKIKSLCMVEEALPEFFARMHDNKESLNSKVEVLKTISRFAGVGAAADFKNGGGDRMVVTINLGADQQLRIERDITPTYDGESDD